MDTIESTTDHVKDRQKPGCCERSSQMGIARRGSLPRTAQEAPVAAFQGLSQRHPPPCKTP